MSIISKFLYATMLGCGVFVENRFNKYTRDCKDVNEQTLFSILSKSLDSEFGLKHDFKSIVSINQYKKQVRLSDYSHYDEYINRMAKGEKNILMMQDVEYFGHTSGTTGKQKLIPVTKSARLVASKYMAILSSKFAYNNFKNQWNYGKGLMIADVVTTLYSEGGIPIRSATSGGMAAIEKVIPYLYTSPFDVMKIKDKEVALYLHALFALKESNMLYISGVFISNVLDFFRVLEKNQELLIKDIRKGKISKSISIDNNIRNRLNKYLSPNAGRADKLEAEFKIGSKGICRRIWPKLAYIASVTGGNFSIYDERVNYYTDSLPIYSTAYGATEGMIGINPYAKEIKYVIIPDTVFYEFIPAEELNNKEPNTYCIHELKIGSKYEIVITNRAGLYRYRLGDIVEVVGFYNNSPEIKFLYRRNQCLNMVSEKTTEAHLTSAIMNTTKKLNINIEDYTTFEDNSSTPGKYIFYIELKNDISKEKIKTLENVLDYELGKANLAYKRFRESKRLGMITVILLSHNTFKNIKESLNLKGISKNQIKIPRVITKNKNILNIINNSHIRRD